MTGDEKCSSCGEPKSLHLEGIGGLAYACPMTPRRFQEALESDLRALENFVVVDEE